MKLLDLLKNKKQPAEQNYDHNNIEFLGKKEIFNGRKSKRPGSGFKIIRYDFEDEQNNYIILRCHERQDGNKYVHQYKINNDGPVVELNYIQKYDSLEDLKKIANKLLKKIDK